MERLDPKETAALLRRILRQRFPACRFSVTTGRGSMVSAVHIRWTDGPTVKAVEAITGQFEAGYFDGMTDAYRYDRDSYLPVEGKAYRPGTRYVETHRDLSDAEQRRIAALLLDPFPVPDAGEWWKGVPRGNCAGYVDLNECVGRAAYDRTEFDRARFDALAWREVREGLRERADGYRLPADYHREGM